MALGMEVFNSSSVADASSSTINATTMGTNRIILVFVHTVSKDGGVRPTVTSVSDANGLTWAKYTNYDFSSADPTNINQHMEVWWAYAAAQQTSNTITVSVSTAARGIGLGVGAISGVPAARYTAPFDADPSMPAKSQNPSETPADPTATFSTHDSHTVGLAVWGSARHNVNSPTTPSGWTSLISLSFNGQGSVAQKLFVYGIVYAAQQVSTTVDLGSVIDWGFIVGAAGGDPIFPHSQVNCPGF